MFDRTPHAPAATVMIDVDRFKDINDGYGHAAGDRVIREVARRCSEVVRPTDLLARYGGDELVAVFVGAPPDEVARVVARLREHVSATPVDTPAGPVHVTLSIGVGAAPHGAPRSTSCCAPPTSRSTGPSPRGVTPSPDAWWARSRPPPVSFPDCFPDPFPEESAGRIAGGRPYT